MASETPQLEDGFIRIANELFDAILATDFTKRETLIVMAVLRKTYGFSKRADDISVSQLSYMTGIGRANASRTFHGLVRRGVLTSSPGSHGNLVAINKRYWEWDDRAKAVPRRAIMERDGWVCRECGRGTPEKHSGLLIDSAPEVDHIVEVSRGGSDDASNLQLLCRKCHQTKTRDYLGERVGSDTNSCQKGHGNRVGSDTKTVSVATRNREGEQSPRVGIDTESVSESTQVPCRNRHKPVSESTHTKDNPNRQLQKTTPKDKGTAALPATGPVWSAYAAAYEQRYGVPPVRNATVNTQLANLVKRIGAEDAPHVAAFYVHHNSAFYVRRGHVVGAMLADAEKLRTEWATNRRVTDTEARQADRRQAAGDEWHDLYQEATAREA